MVSDMREWCNQSKYICPVCKNEGVYDIIDPNYPFGIYIPKICACSYGKKFDKESREASKILCMPTWDFIWMELAKNISMKSTCKVPNRQVGCVIVSEDNTKVLSNGYNGSAKGDDNSCDYTSDAHVKVGESRCTCVHAEMNALVKLDTSNPIKKKMYLTLSPCSLCYKLIVNAGISEVIYEKEYKVSILQKLEELGVKVRKYA